LHEPRYFTVKANKQLFQSKNFGFLATLMPDGSPQVTPTWVDADATISLSILRWAG